VEDNERKSGHEDEKGAGRGDGARRGGPEAAGRGRGRRGARWVEEPHPDRHADEELGYVRQWVELESVEPGGAVDMGGRRNAVRADEHVGDGERHAEDPRRPGTSERPARPGAREPDARGWEQ
jgi:hypothetical protein